MIYKRGSQYWYKFRWSLKNSDGIREHFLVRKSARTGSQRKAREVEEEHRRALRLGQIHPLDPWPKPQPTASPLPTAREFLPQFLKYAQVHTKPGTSRFYERSLKHILGFAALANVAMAEITGEVISKYAQWRSDRDPAISVWTINGELRGLRRMFRLAAEWGVIPKAPAIHELPGSKCRNRVISFAEEARYLSAAHATVRDAALLAVDTGLRPNSELFQLKWANVHLNGAGNAPQGFLHVGGGKTSNAVRNIPLTPRTCEMLLRRQQVTGGSSFVFPGPGRTGHIVTFQHAHERTIEKAELQPFEFYCWRHTFGTRCAESGMDKFSLARLMGHSSPSLAERYYIHVTEPHVMAGFERFVAYQTNKLIDVVPRATSRAQ
jgi:integrase